MMRVLMPLVALTLCMSAALGAGAPSEEEANGLIRLENSSVSLTGSASESVEPDRAGFTIVMRSCESDSRYDAVKASAKTVQTLRSELESSAYVESVATESYYVSEKKKYGYDRWGEYRELGTDCYEITHKLRVESDSPDSLGALIDIAMRDGAENVESMGFGLSDSRKSELSKRLSREALDDAHENLAYLVPEAENAILQKVSVSISYGSWRYYPGYTFGAGGFRYEEMEEPTEIEIPDIEVIGTAKADYVVWDEVRS